MERTNINDNPERVKDDRAKIYPPKESFFNRESTFIGFIANFANGIKNNLVPSFMWSGLETFASPVSSMFETVANKIVNLLPGAARDKILSKSLIKNSMLLVVPIAVCRGLQAFFKGWDKEKGLFKRSGEATYAAGEVLAEGAAGAAGSALATAVMGTGLIAGAASLGCAVVAASAVPFTASIAKKAIGHFTDKVLKAMESKSKILGKA